MIWLRGIAFQSSLLEMLAVNYAGLSEPRKVDNCNSLHQARNPRRHIKISNRFEVSYFNLHDAVINNLATSSHFNTWIYKKYKRLVK